MTLTTDQTTSASPPTGAQAPTHQVALTFEDGVTRFVTCREDQTVADASYRQRINIRMSLSQLNCDFLYINPFKAHDTSFKSRVLYRSEPWRG